MITMTWTSAPAGFPRAGSFDVRYRRCTAAVSEVQGTGLPTAGAGARDGRLVGSDVFVDGIALPSGTAMAAAQKLTAQQSTAQKFRTTNGTTLGYLSPGRPTS